MASKLITEISHPVLPKDIVSELDMYGFIQSRVYSQGRYGRRREITVNLPKEISDQLRKVVLMKLDLN